MFKDFKIKINAIPRVKKITPKMIDDLTHEILNASTTFLLCNAFKAPYIISGFYSSLLFSIFKYLFLNIFILYCFTGFSASFNSLNIMKNQSMHKAFMQEKYILKNMPIVHVNVWKGFSNEAKKKVIEGITKVFVELGIPKEAVEIVIHEIPMENWGINGEQASEKFKYIKAP